MRVVLAVNPRKAARKGKTMAKKSKKRGRKKARSAAQKAATKRMIAAAKRKRAGKSTTRKRRRKASVASAAPKRRRRRSAAKKGGVRRRRRRAVASAAPVRRRRRGSRKGRKHTKWGAIKAYKRKSTVRGHRRRTNPDVKGAVMAVGLGGLGAAAGLGVKVLSDKFLPASLGATERGAIQVGAGVLGGIGIALFANPFAGVGYAGALLLSGGHQLAEQAFPGALGPAQSTPTSTSTGSSGAFKAAAQKSLLKLNAVVDDVGDFDDDDVGAVVDIDGLGAVVDEVGAVDVQLEAVYEDMGAIEDESDFENGEDYDDEDGDDDFES